MVLSSRARASLVRDALALVGFGCRWYDAETGRWISKDPILLDGGWNVYAFCDNDPINRTDPSGLAQVVVEDVSGGRNVL